MYAFKKKRASRSKVRKDRSRRIPSGTKVTLAELRAERTVERVGTPAQFRAAFLLGREFGALSLAARGISGVLGTEPEEVYQRIAVEFERIGDWLYPPSPRAAGASRRVKVEDEQSQGGA